MARRLSVEEYFRLPESLQPSELVFGSVREPPAPFYSHQLSMLQQIGIVPATAVGG